MMVTKLTASKRVQGRWYVDFDTGESMKVTDTLVTEFVLTPGRELSDGEYTELREVAVVAAAKSRALNILGAKMCSSGQLRHRLIELGETQEIADETVEWCFEMQLLDDTEYARQVVAGYFARGYGARKIRDELYKRRVPRELWDNALEHVNSGSFAAMRALEIVEQKLRGEKPDYDDRRKLGAMLARRGFSWDEINAAFTLYAENVNQKDLEIDE